MSINYCSWTLKAYISVIARDKRLIFKRSPSFRDLDPHNLVATLAHLQTNWLLDGTLFEGLYLGNGTC